MKEKSYSTFFLGFIPFTISFSLVALFLIFLYFPLLLSGGMDGAE